MELSRVLFAVVAFSPTIKCTDRTLGNADKLMKPHQTLPLLLGLPDRQTDQLMARHFLPQTAAILPSILRCYSNVFSVRANVVFQTRRQAHCLVHPANSFIKISEEVRDAVEQKRPVVALETTIYTHGE